MIKPIADKYELSAVYLFGSYARGEADNQSDIDLAYYIMSHGESHGFLVCLRRIRNFFIDA
ncbi:nucleotidyltransferase domain-containing protein [Streptococcus agalactiae]